MTSSSPRDQIQTWPPRLTTCARMPSYFHSTIQSAGEAEPRRELGDRRIELVRQEERVRLADVERGRRSALARQMQVARGARRRRGVGVAHHALRDELRVEPRASASARCTSSLLTPTRKPPPISLLSRKRPAVSSSSQYDAMRSACSFGREAAQRQQALLDPLGEAEVARAARGGGSTCATVSAKSPTAW